MSGGVRLGFGRIAGRKPMWARTPRSRSRPQQARRARVPRHRARGRRAWRPGWWS